MSGAGAVGLVLEGKYRLLEEIGSGAMGTVFRAKDESLDRVVAVKFLLPEHEARRDLVRRFQREARAMASLAHENVAAINALGQHGRSHYFVMEYVQGESADLLLEAARRTGRMPSVRLAIRILDQVCAGLGAVHRAGVVHRDVKPGNIILEAETGRVVITDFGLGRQLGKADQSGTRGIGGTPGYLAPEIISEAEIPRGEEYLTDLYALGATAFELLTGELVFDESSVVLILKAHLTTPPRRASSVRAEVPEELDEIVLRCLAKDPRDRFPSCEAVREALARVPSQPTPRAPARRSSAPAPDSRPPAASDAVTPVRVLVAHPEPDRRAALVEAVRGAIPSCRIWTANNSAEGLALARKQAPLVFVAALDDPSVHGVELVGELRADGRLRTTRLVLVGRPVSSRDRELLERLGVADFVADDDLGEPAVRVLRGCLKPKGGPASPRAR